MSLRVGDINRARRMFKSLRECAPDNMAHLLDVTVHNAFIEAYIARGEGNLQDAVVWYERMEKDYGVKPDVTTYALIIKGHLT
jgi:DNA-directed RNA polymerase